MRKIAGILYVLILLASCKKVELIRLAKITTDTCLVNNGYITLKGSIIDIPKQGITAHGHCYSNETNPKISTASFYNNNDVTEQGTFSSAIANLLADKTYYYRSFAISGNDTIYGAQKIFSTAGIYTFKISTSNPEITGSASATVDGSITDFASLVISDYGHCVSTTETEPTISTTLYSYGNLTASKNFTTNINSIPLDKTYYIRSYAVLSDKTILYGNTVQIIIPSLQVQTESYTIPTTNNATLQGSIKELGIYPVTEHGHCWSSLTSNPNINNSKSSLGAISNKETYFSTLPNMQVGIDYYYRAYAITGNQVKYGVVYKIDN